MGRRLVTSRHLRKTRRDGGNLDFYNDMINEKVNRMMLIRDMLLSVDDVIRKIGWLIRRTQPNRSGKYDVRWWIDNKSRVRNPVMVRWMPSTGRLGFKPVVAKRKPYATWGAWGLCHEETVRLYEMYREASLLRDKLLRRFRREVSIVSGPLPDIGVTSAWEDELEAMRKQVDEKLIRAGYLGNIGEFPDFDEEDSDSSDLEGNSEESAG